MKISPELTTRLIALQSLLDLGEIELVKVASAKLAGSGEAPELVALMEALDDRRYSEASAMIKSILSEGSRLTQWVDPEFHNEAAGLFRLIKNPELVKEEIERIKEVTASLRGSLKVGKLKVDRWRKTEPHVTTSVSKFTILSGAMKPGSRVTVTKSRRSKRWPQNFSGTYSGLIRLSFFVSLPTLRNPLNPLKAFGHARKV